jgi:predicted Ser/Thr protein kinase
MLRFQTLAGRYEMRRQIGVGGMARVYLAWDDVLHRNVAVKVLNEGVSTDPAFVARFRREAQAAASLQSPHIVQVYDWGSSADHDWPLYFLVMEYVAGPNLKEALRDRGALPEREALRIAADIAAALEVAHRYGIIHRDIKPHNVLLGPGGTVKVTDFGIARATGLTQLTTTQSAVYGSAHYVSPEQAQRRTVDHRSDIYSLGAVLYEMLTGREPFSGESFLDVALQHVHGSVVPPGQVHPGISSRTDAIVIRALAKDPAERFPDAGSMRRVLLESAAAPERKGASTLPTTPTSIPSARSAPAESVVRRVMDTPRRGTRREARARKPALPSWLPVLAATLLVLGAGLAVLHALAGGHTALSHHADGTHAARSTAEPHHGGVSATTRPGSKRSLPTPAQARQTASAPIAAPRSGEQAPTRSTHPIAAPPASAPASASTAVPGPAATSAPVPPAGAAAPGHTGPPPSATGSPEQAVEAFYADVGHHDFAAAARLWTPSMRDRYPPAANIDTRFSGTSGIVVDHWSVVRASADRARVDVTLTEYLRGGGSRALVGSWDLVRTGGTWLLDNPSF